MQHVSVRKSSIRVPQATTYLTGAMVALGGLMAACSDAPANQASVEVPMMPTGMTGGSGGAQPDPTNVGDMPTSTAPMGGAPDLGTSGAGGGETAMGGNSSGGMGGAAMTGGAGGDMSATGGGGAESTGGAGGAGDAENPNEALGLMSIGVGPFAACAFGDDRMVKCWGRNYMQPRSCNANMDQWGIGNCVGRATAPNDLGQVSALTSIHTGVCAIVGLPDDPDRRLRCWGPELKITPPDPKGLTILAGGDRHACGMDEEGKVTCWGWNNKDTAHQPPQDLRASMIAGSGVFNCAIRKEDSVVQCWGERVPEPPQGLTAKRISGGGGYGGNVDHHACAITMDDDVVCWGDGAGAQVPEGLKAKEVAAGLGYSCAVLLDGSAQCWGKFDAPAGNDFRYAHANRGVGVLVKKDGSIVMLEEYTAGAVENLPKPDLNILLP